MESSERIMWIDTLRGFAILLVVFGHILLMRYWPDGALVKKYIYSFHMPLFMLISGLFAVKTLKFVSFRTMGDYLKRKAFQLMIPFCVFGFFFLLVHRKPNVWQDYILLGGREYWFLWVLLQFFCWVALLATLYHRISKKYNIPNFMLWGILLVPIMVMHIVDGTFAQILSKQNFLFNYPFFVLGIALSTYDELMRDVVNTKLAIILFVIYLTLMNVLSFPYIEYLRAFCIIQPLISLFYTIHQLQVFAIVGRSSLEIYILHYYFCYLIPHHAFPALKNVVGGILVVISIFILSTIICYFCVALGLLLQRYSWIKRYCFGK